LLILELVNHLVCIHTINFRFNLAQLREVIDDLLKGDTEKVRADLKKMKEDYAIEVEKEDALAKVKAAADKEAEEAEEKER